MLAAHHYAVTVEVNRKSDKGSILQSRLFRAQSGQGVESTDTLSFLAVDHDTFDEYELTQPVNTEYTQKISKWISSGKYQCGDSTSEGELSLRLGDVFDFRLKKRAKTDIEKVKEQMKGLKEDRSKIDRQMKLFNMYFFCFWKEQQREPLLKYHLQGSPLTDVS